MPNFGDFQFQIYLQGLSGVRPGLPITYPELECRAHAAAGSLRRLLRRRGRG